MIRGFADGDTERVYHGERPAGFPSQILKARRKLAMIDAATKLDDLKSPPGNRLHPLDQRSIPRLLQMERRRRIRSRNHGLPSLKQKEVDHAPQAPPSSPRRSPTRGVYGATRLDGIRARSRVAGSTNSHRANCTRTVGHNRRYSFASRQVVRNVSSVLA